MYMYILLYHRRTFSSRPLSGHTHLLMQYFAVNCPNQFYIRINWLAIELITQRALFLFFCTVTWRQVPVIFFVRQFVPALFFDIILYIHVFQLSKSSKIPNIFFNNASKSKNKNNNFKICPILINMKFKVIKLLFKLQFKNLRTWL